LRGSFDFSSENNLQHHSVLTFSFSGTARACKGLAITYSPAAHIPADHTRSREMMQKKLIDWPISSHDPVSVTLRKNVIVIPSVKVRAMRNNEYGGRRRRAFSVANAAERMTYGATILKRAA